MALIPKGPFRGHLLAWTYNIPPCANHRGIPSGFIYWSIIDPEKAQSDPTREMNFVRLFPPTQGNPNDIACSGHMWLPDGRLWVVGGTEDYGGLSCPSDPLAKVVGARLCTIFDPDVPVLLNYPTDPPGYNMWSAQPLQATRRWYPTGTLGSHLVAPFGSRLSLGGHLELNPPLTRDTYEVWTTLAGWRLVYDGPSLVLNGAVSALFAYPRTLLLSNAYVFNSGMYGDSLSAPPPYRSSALNPPYDPLSSTQPDWRLRGHDSHARIYGSSVLFPNVAPAYKDAVMSMGGMDSAGVVRNTAALCKASLNNSGPFPTGHDWLALTAMNHARVYLNAVLLPDASVFVVGGSSDNQMLNPVMEAERYRNGAWEKLAAMQVARVYHSTALLLPKATVVVAAGEGAGHVYPFETYHPPYLFCGTRPQWSTPFPPELLAYGGTYEAWPILPVGAVVAKVVFMRAGSVTHHFDQDQRYLEMLAEPSASGEPFVTFTLPTNRDELPPGYYMGFLVTTTGLVSEARWFRLLP